jgi:hypothetical protein
MFNGYLKFLDVRLICYHTLARLRPDLGGHINGTPGIVESNKPHLVSM